MSRIISIDFGTSNTIIAEWISAQMEPRTILLDRLSRPFGPPSVPSLVFFDNAATQSVRIGFPVIDGGLDQHREAQRRLFRSMKRDLLESGSSNDFDIDGVSVSPRQAAELFLRGVCQSIAASDSNIHELVLTAPVIAFEAYLRWLGSAVATINLPQNVVPRVIDEPTAAAFGYKLDFPGGKVLVIDFGGGTLDLSLVHLPMDQDRLARGIVVPQGVLPEVAFAQHRTQITARVIAKTARRLGGDDIDQVFVDWLLRSESVARKSVGNDMPKLMKVVEEAKIELGQANEFELNVYLSSIQKSIRRRISRQEFERNVLDSPFIGIRATLVDALTEVLAEAALKHVAEVDIDRVLLVGGSTLIPSVREWIQLRFGEKVLYNNPFEAVAHGALRLAASHPFEDILQHSYVLEVMSRTHSELAAYDYLPIVKSGTLYPLVEPVELETFLKPMVDGVTKIDFVIAEMGEDRKSGERKVFDAHGRLMPNRGLSQVARGQTIRYLRSQCSVNLNPPGKRSEEDRLEVSFTIDENRRLLLTVFDTVANRRLVTEEPVARLE